MCVCAIETAPVVNLENGGGGRVASRESVGERRRSSVTQDLTEYTYSVAEEPDAEVADDDDVFEMEAGGGGGEQTAPGNGSAGGGATSEAKRRTQSLGSLTGEPKSPRKVLNVAYVNNLKLLLFFFLLPFLCCSPRPFVLPLTNYLPISIRTNLQYKDISVNNTVVDRRKKKITFGGQ